MIVPFIVVVLFVAFIMITLTVIFIIVVCFLWPLFSRDAPDFRSGYWYARVVTPAGALLRSHHSMHLSKGHTLIILTTKSKDQRESYQVDKEREEEEEEADGASEANHPCRPSPRTPRRPIVTPNDTILPTTTTRTRTTRTTLE